KNLNKHRDLTTTIGDEELSTITLQVYFLPALLSPCCEHSPPWVLCTELADSLSERQRLMSVAQHGNILHLQESPRGQNTTNKVWNSTSDQFLLGNQHELSQAETPMVGKCCSEKKGKDRENKDEQHGLEAIKTSGLCYTNLRSL